MSSTTTTPVDATAEGLKAATKLAMADQLFVEYLTRTYPDPVAFASLTTSEHYTSTLYHCWMSARKSMADEFLSAVQENPTAPLTPNC